MFEDSFDAIVIFDDGRFTDVDESAAELFSVARKGLLGRSYTEFVLDDFDAKAVWSGVVAATEERETFTLQRSDGTERIVEYAAVPGQHLAILRDVTGRIERERRYEAVSEGFPDLCFVLDEDGVHRDMLSSAASQDGLYVDPSEFLGRPIDEVPPQAVGELALKHLRETVETGKQQTYEYELDVPTGNRRFEARTYPLSVTQESKRLVPLVTRDITCRATEHVGAEPA